eukprot:TRINITY_DN19372_c0_g2_i1.p1 TRINITY_DN19372_c0_g2~~TRINITY_DN19372_c0_g2_i1.p1  ORF type:complete len:268 (+),score=16.81 TRINITY_DN19372_c0_g2_i1:85-804(+)
MDADQDCTKRVSFSASIPQQDESLSRRPMRRQAREGLEAPAAIDEGTEMELMTYAIALKMRVLAAKRVPHKDNAAEAIWRSYILKQGVHDDDGRETHLGLEHLLPLARARAYAIRQKIKACANRSRKKQTNRASSSDAHACESVSQGVEPLESTSPGASNEPVAAGDGKKRWPSLFRWTPSRSTGRLRRPNSMHGWIHDDEGGKGSLRGGSGSRLWRWPLRRSSPAQSSLAAIVPEHQG